jgi:hypothetical protein
VGSVLLIPITIWLLILPAVLPGVRVPPSAATDVSRAVGVARPRALLSYQEVRAVARTVDVSEEVVLAVAPRVNELPAWRRAVQAAIAVHEQTRGTTRAITVGVACDIFQGDIRNEEQLIQSVAEQAYWLTKPQILQLAKDAIEMYSVLREEAASGTDDDKVALALFCVILENAPS